MAYQGRAAKEFIDLDLVQTHLRAATKYVSANAGQLFNQGMNGFMRWSPSLQFDSPLEVVFWVWWHACIEDTPLIEYLYISPQQEVFLDGCCYRVDFLIKPTHPQIEASPDWKPIAVEVDGHEFHERTPDQVATRDRRDRVLQAAGWKVFHFSYREFTAAPSTCVEEVLLFAKKQWSLTTIRDSTKTHKVDTPDAR